MNSKGKNFFDEKKSFEEIRALNEEKLRLFRQIDATSDQLLSMNEIDNDSLRKKAKAIDTENVDKMVNAIERAYCALNAVIAKGDAISAHLCRGISEQSDARNVVKIVADLNTQSRFKETIELLLKLDLNDFEKTVKNEQFYESVRGKGDAIWMNAIENIAKFNDFLREMSLSNLDCQNSL